MVRPVTLLLATFALCALARPALADKVSELACEPAPPPPPPEGRQCLGDLTDDASCRPDHPLGSPEAGFAPFRLFPDTVPAARLDWPSPGGLRLAFAAAAQGRARPGFTRRVERPPRALLPVDET